MGLFDKLKGLVVGIQRAQRPAHPAPAPKPDDKPASQPAPSEKPPR